MAKRSIFLVGPMGAGKSTVGRRLARRAGLRFVDSDRAIEERTGVDIPTIFDIEGEAGFRSREESMIDRLTSQPGIVLATGGGAILRDANRERLRSRGLVVYLRATVDTQLARTRHSDRPLLRDTDPAGKLEALLRERDPLYRSVADIVVDTDDGRIEDVVDTIWRQVRESAHE
ncbi:MAG TPA: shikimate kinase AroK [Gammaproteobacteria bacterium]|nr:shikimate kinase AroK [Gammaproteobacteria bacterium]